MRKRHSKFAKAIFASLIIILYGVMIFTIGCGVMMMCVGRSEGLVLVFVSLFLCPIIFAANSLYECLFYSDL